MSETIDFLASINPLVVFPICPHCDRVQAEIQDRNK